MATKTILVQSETGEMIFAEVNPITGLPVSYNQKEEDCVPVVHDPNSKFVQPK